MERIKTGILTALGLVVSIMIIGIFMTFGLAMVGIFFAVGLVATTVALIGSAFQTGSNSHKSTEAT